MEAQVKPLERANPDSPEREQSDGDLLAAVTTRYRRAYSPVLENGAFDALRSVLTSVSHALSDLLMPVCEYPRLIQKSLPGNSPAQELSERITLASDRLCEINEHLIRLCDGNEDTPMNVEMGTLIQGVLSDLRHQGEIPPAIHVSVRTDERPAWLHGPQDALYLAARDMCLNAIASMAGGGTLTVKIGSVSVRPGDAAHLLGIPARNHLGVRFQDDGPGIDPACRETLFDPFVSTTPGEGFGLGLSSVYRTLRHFGGEILYKPDGGSGADFLLLFPLETP